MGLKKFFSLAIKIFRLEQQTSFSFFEFCRGGDLSIAVTYLMIFVGREGSIFHESGKKKKTFSFLNFSKGTFRRPIALAEKRPNPGF